MTGFVEMLVLITFAVSVTALVIAGAAHLGRAVDAVGFAEATGGPAGVESRVADSSRPSRPEEPPARRRRRHTRRRGSRRG